MALQILSDSVFCCYRTTELKTKGDYKVQISLAIKPGFKKNNLGTISRC